MIIDIHVHLGKGDPDHSALQGDLFPEQVIKVMDEGGVDKAVVFPVQYRDFRQAIQEIKGYVDEHPDRLIGFARVGNTPDAAEILEWAVKELGMKGVKIHHGLEKIPVDSPHLDAVMKKAEELDVPVIFDAFVHNADKAMATAERYGGPIILAHMGGLWHVDAMDRCIAFAEQHPNICLETSSVLMYQKIEEAVRRIGSARVLFGTDGPGIHPGPEIAKIRILHISEAEKANILGLNARRLLKL
jgi:predicted TIM-barrel fold metal-dependent hydrolase